MSQASSFAIRTTDRPKSKFWTAITVNRGSRQDFEYLKRVLDNIWGEGASKWATFNSVTRHGEKATANAEAGVVEGGVNEKNVYPEDLDLPNWMQVP